MRQKSTEKHTEKKQIPDLFPVATGAKRIDNAFATAAQLLPYTGLDESALRRRSLEINPATAAPWIPKPRRSQWPVHETLIGICAWRTHQATTAATRGLPSQCANMTDLESAYHLPVEFQKYIRERGLAPDAFEASNRVNLLPLLKALQPILTKIFSRGGARLAEITGFEDLDLDTQRALSTAQDVITKTRDNALANKELHTREGIERELGEPLSHVAAAWKSFEKNVGGKIKTLLAAAGVAPELIQQTVAIATAGVTEPLTKLRAELKLDQPAPTTPTKSGSGLL